MRNGHATLPDNDPVYDGPERNDRDYSTCRKCGVRLDYGKTYCGGSTCINMARQTDDYRTTPDDEEPS